MDKIFDSVKLENLLITCNRSERIIIISHVNPDGDAIGSGLALKLFLQNKFPSKHIRFFVPNQFPDFLKWVDPNKDIEIFSEMYGEGTAYIAAADLIFVVDFNQTSRLDKMSSALDANIHAPRVLIDHHIAPPDFDFAFHSIESSSTAFMIYNFIERLDGTDAITKPIADALYLGIMTDTGCFSFGNLTPELYRAVGTLVEKGINPPEINRAVYNCQSKDRVRMVGYLMSEKMVVDHEKAAGYITLAQDEKDRFNHQIGDTEGVVNIPLTIKGINFSAILIESLDHIKISLRSIGDIDVNLICRNHFNGGGHRNAAGGKFFGSMEEAVEALKRVISEL